MREALRVGVLTLGMLLLLVCGVLVAYRMWRPMERGWVGGPGGPSVRVPQYPDVGDWAAEVPPQAGEPTAEELRAFRLDQPMALPEWPSAEPPRGPLPPVNPDDPHSAAEGVRL